jgi:hypothetical protein
MSIIGNRDEIRLFFRNLADSIPTDDSGCLRVTLDKRNGQICFQVECDRGLIW